MTHRHRMRRGVAPRPSEKDLRLLNRLVTRARPLAADAMRDGEPFSTAADKAARAILPAGHQSDAHSPFVALIRLGKRWLLIPVAERPAMQTELKTLADRCADVLDEIRTGGPGELKRVRKDIDE